MNYTDAGAVFGQITFLSVFYQRKNRAGRRRSAYPNVLSLAANRIDAAGGGVTSAFSVFSIYFSLSVDGCIHDSERLFHVSAPEGSISKYLCFAYF